MANPSNPNDESIIREMTKGALDWSLEKIKLALSKLMHRDLAFIEDRETIDTVRAQRASVEWDFLEQYIRDKKLRILIQLGLTLRRLETQSLDRLEQLRSKIHKKYGTHGLRIAEFIQAGILGTFIGVIIPKEQTPADFIDDIEQLLNDVEKYVVFVKNSDNVQKKSRDILVRLRANMPPTLILCGTRGAREKTEKIAQSVKKGTDDYEVTINEDGIKRIIIFSKKNK